MNFALSINLDKTYVFVYQKDIDLFAVVWMYPNGDTPAYVVGRKVLQNFINRFNFGFIDNEIFLLWLNENKDIIQTAYQKCKEKYEKIMELQNS